MYMMTKGMSAPSTTSSTAMMFTGMIHARLLTPLSVLAVQSAGMKDNTFVMQALYIHTPSCII